MNLQRKLTLMVATGAVALGAGHMVQQKATARTAAAQEPTVKVSSITPVAAGPEVTELKKPAFVPPALPAEASAQVVVAEPPARKPRAMFGPFPLPAAKLAELPAALPKTVLLATTPTLPAEVPVMDLAAQCEVQLDLIPQPGAMIGVTLLAPCHPQERVVLRHAGLAVTGRTSASGALIASIPALTVDAVVEVAFGAKDLAAAEIKIPEAADLQRFAAQWQDADAFQLHAFENGAGYDQPGHISAAYTGAPGDSGFLTVLGDATTDLPLLAEVFTFAKDHKTEVVIEAAVTATTCGREILGETVAATNGTVTVTGLTLAMPDCAAVGDILVLKNLMQDMTLASAN